MECETHSSVDKLFDDKAANECNQSEEKVSLIEVKAR